MATINHAIMERPPVPAFVPGFTTQDRGSVSFPRNHEILARTHGTMHNRNMNPYGYNRPSPPAKFDGSDDPVALNNWSKIRQHYLTMCGLSLNGLECVYMVGTHLSGGALSFYTERVIDHYDEYHNFAALYAGLREHFLRPEWGDDLIAQWTNVVQRNGESIRSLAQRLTAIMDVPPYPMDEQQLIHKLLYSMRPDIHERVMSLINPGDQFETSLSQRNDSTSTWECIACPTQMDKAGSPTPLNGTRDKPNPSTTLKHRLVTTNEEETSRRS